jgi:hypothetical protein
MGPSGIYFARVRIGGKLIRQSLKTEVFSVAQLRLGDLIKQEREKLVVLARVDQERAEIPGMVMVMGWENWHWIRLGLAGDRSWIGPKPSASGIPPAAHHNPTAG